MRHPDPRGSTAGVDHGLGQGRRPGAQRRGAAAVQRHWWEPVTLTEHCDVLIVGGGHNGLVAAAYLGRAGRRVTLLEARSTLGGAVASAPVFPGVGARLSRFAYLISLLPEKIIAELGLDLELRSRAVRSYTPVGNDGVLVRRSAGELTGLEADLRSFAEVVEPTLTEPLPRAQELRARVDPALWQALVERPIGELIETTEADDTR